MLVLFYKRLEILVVLLVSSLNPKQFANFLTSALHDLKNKEKVKFIFIFIHIIRTVRWVSLDKNDSNLKIVLGKASKGIHWQMLVGGRLVGGQ